MNQSVMRRRARAAASLTVLCGVVGGLLVAPTAAFAAPVISGGGGSYTEQAPPVLVAQDLVITGGTSFAGQYMDFAISGATSSETLSMLTAGTAATGAGVVSIVGTSVYLGNGTTADPIGSLDPVRNGTGGQPLRVNFTSEFSNPSFETGSASGWTPIESRVDLGVTSIAGFVPTDTSTYPSNVPNRDDNAPLDIYQNSVTVQSSVRSSGTYAMQLTSSMTTAQGCDVVHGPAVYSDTFPAASGDKIYFDWRAYQGDDNYHVFGYIVDQYGVQTEVLDATGGGNTNWTTKETTIPSTGDYRFVFVAGTHDATCGQAAGASLYIDNVRVFGTRATGTVVQDIARLLQYANSSDDPALTRTVAVTAASNDAGTGTGQFDIDITPVDDPPVAGTTPDVVFTNAYGAETRAAVTGQLAASDPDDDAIAYAISGAVAEAATIGGTAYSHRVDYAYGAVHYDAATGRFVVVPDDAAIDPRQSDDSASLSYTASASGQTATGSLTLRVSVPASAPGEPVEVEAESGVERVRLTWAPNVWTGGSATTAYIVESSTDGVSWVEAARTPDARTFVDVVGLTGGQSYDFRVRAVNATGTSGASTIATAMPISVPTAPQDVAAQRADQGAVVSWTAPASDGGRTVLDYRVEVSTDGGESWSTATGAAVVEGTTVRVTGLENGVPASFRVIARNSVGDSLPSSVVSETPGTVASAPLNGVIEYGDGTIGLTWEAPATDGGAPLTGYVVERKIDGEWVTVAETGVDERSARFEGLTNGEAVELRVRAVNSEGLGASLVLEPTTPRTTAGAATIVAVERAARRLLLTIEAPENDGGAAIIGYDASIDGGATWTRTVATGERWTLWGLSNGVRYEVMVRAVNSEGFGPSSEVVAGTPVLAPLADGRGLMPVLPTVAPGGSLLLVNGEAREVAEGTSRTGLRFRSDELVVDLSAIESDGGYVDADGQGRLVMTGDAQVLVAGSGFAPGSTVDVWLLSTRVLLGQVTVDADGAFSQLLPLPEDVTMGDHTLQLNGTSANGETASLSVGITLAAAVAPALAVTGGSLDGAGLLLLAGLLLGGGVLLRRRRAVTAG